MKVGFGYVQNVLVVNPYTFSGLRFSARPRSEVRNTIAVFLKEELFTQDLEQLKAELIEAGVIENGVMHLFALTVFLRQGYQTLQTLDLNKMDRAILAEFDDHPDYLSRLEVRMPTSAEGHAKRLRTNYRDTGHLTS